MPPAESATFALPGAADAPAVERVPCTHCGLDVPPALLPAESRAPSAEPGFFCCTGCRAAYAILHEGGLDQYYGFAERRDRPVTTTGRKFEEFDHEAFQRIHVRPSALAGLSRVELYLEGVHCASCVWLVERVPLLLPGVARAELQVRRSLATIEWDPSVVPLSRIARTLDTLGYAPHPYRGLKREEVRRAEDRASLVRIGVAGAIAVNIMLASVALYSGFLNGMESQYEQLFRWLALALVIPAIAWPGRVFFVGAASALRTRRVHMDLPIAIAIGIGFIRGAMNTVSGSGPIYFDGLATLIFVLLVGRYLQQRGQRAAADSAELLFSLTPHRARVVGEDGSPFEVPAEGLVPGMVFEVLPGESFAADGTVMAGESSLDESLLTGESVAVRTVVGDPVFAGTLNLASPLRVRVDQPAEKSRVARIAKMVEESATRRAPVVLLADRTAGWFVVTVLVLALATWAYWMGRDPAHALDNAIALLIVTCPCALAMATPLAITVAIGRAARRGLFIKGGEAIELLARPARLLLDKTGTITEARTSLIAFAGPSEVRPLVLALERESTHPVAEGLRRAWGADAGALPAVERSEHVSGGGITGRVAGRDLVVGSPAFVAARSAGAAPALVGAEGATPVWIALNGRIVAAAALGDPIRADARASIDTLRSRGWEVGILSGDALAVVQSVASQLGLPAENCTGGVSPEGKLERVREAMRSGRVVMAGDGVNDAAAIAAASVGIGVHGGAEVCLANADVYLTTPGLAPLLELTEGAARTMRLIRINMGFSLAYNAVGVALAVTGQINPLIAAIMMPLSSVTVVFSSWYGRSFARDQA